MPLDVARLAQAMEDEAIVELTNTFGGNLNEAKAREGIAPMALGFARAVVNEITDNAAVSVPGVTSGGDTAGGTVS